MNRNKGQFTSSKPNADDSASGVTACGVRVRIGCQMQADRSKQLWNSEGPLEAKRRVLLVIRWSCGQRT
uniref:Uncharacterized protein n=1 Tax=Kalanchoe fedtschenkoi TaxID=63787 RepID=A0A7N0RGS5_KALFE